MSRGQLAQRGDLGLDQVADGAAAAQRHVVDAGVLAVYRAESVRDVQVDGCREPVGEVPAGHVVLAGLGLVEAQVLEHDQAAGGHRRDRGAGLRADDVTGEVHLPAEQFAEAGGDRCQRIPRVRPAAGTAEMSADDHPGTAADQRGQGRQASPDPAVIRDPVAVHGHVQVGTHQHPPALDRDIVDRLHRHAISSSRRPAGRLPRARGTSLVPAQARRSGSFGATRGDLRPRGAAEGSRPAWSRPRPARSRSRCRPRWPWGGFTGASPPVYLISLPTGRRRPGRGRGPGRRAGSSRCPGQGARGDRACRAPPGRRARSSWRARGRDARG